jgi:plastocyanin
MGRQRRAIPFVLLLIAAMTAACADDNSAGQTSAGATTSVGSSGTTIAATTGATEILATEPVVTEPVVTEPVVTSSTLPTMDDPIRPGAQRLHLEVGPLDVKPGQNNITIAPGKMPQPPGDGWIVRIAPNLRYEDGTVPGVDVIHLHHGVWLNVGARDATRPNLPERFFASGEEKTTTILPDGYGYKYRSTDGWILNYMLHNLWPDPAKVWITYDIDFIPANAPEAKQIVAARPIWMDVQNGGVYPVFDVLKGSGLDGRYTYPTDATDPYGVGKAKKNEWVVDRKGVLLATAGHLHPGGLQTDLWATRDGQTAHVFTSKANYYEPAGAVSWDVSMGATPPDWRVEVNKGDVLSTTATYDSARASWYESMGIMVVWMANAVASNEPPAPDPFSTSVDMPGLLTHGHLAENDNHGGAPDPTYFDATALPSADARPTIPIGDFVYGQGDMLLGDPVPTVKAGGVITFDNLDAPLENGIWHTITACKTPCNQSTGIAYPLADGDVTFDSGELGDVGPPTAGRTTWSTPADLPPGTYTYFCRIHPFMRGAFRVIPAS